MQNQIILSKHELKEAIADYLKIDKIKIESVDFSLLNQMYIIKMREGV
jgi:hypothetical protein